MSLSLIEKGKQVILPVRVTPRSVRDELSGVKEGILQVRVRAAPTQGRANAACLKVVARVLGVRSSAITLHKGATGRLKKLGIAGLTKEQIQDLLRNEELPDPGSEEGNG